MELSALHQKREVAGIPAERKNLWVKELAGLTPVTPAFDKVWKAIAKREPELFRNAQFAFMYRTNYLTTVAKVERLTGVDLDTFSSSVRAVVFSTVNQHGKASVPLTRAINATNKLIKADDPAYEETLIRQIYAQRAGYVIGVAKNNKNPGQKKQLKASPKSDMFQRKQMPLPSCNPAHKLRPVRRLPESCALAAPAP